LPALLVLPLLLLCSACTGHANPDEATPGRSAVDGFVGLVSLDGQPVAPLAQDAPAHVFLFVRNDCPISNRYAPEWQRIHARFSPSGVRFWLVYPDPEEPLETIRTHLAEFKHPGEPLRDPEHRFVRATGASVTPEAALFDGSGRLVYRGRIDDRYVDFGKTRAAPTRHDLIEAIQSTLDGKPVAQATTRAVGCFIPELRDERR